MIVRTKVTCQQRGFVTEFFLKKLCKSSLRQQPTFGDATTSFPAKWRLRIERRNSILMTRHYPDLGSVSDWLKQISCAARPIRKLPRSDWWLVISMEFLHLFLKRYKTFCFLYYFLFLPFIVWSLRLSIANILEVKRLVLWLSTDVKSRFLNTFDRLRRNVHWFGFRCIHIVK